jgi:hypothetical protein
VLGGFAVHRGCILERRWLERWVDHDATVGRGIGGGRADSTRAMAPNLLKLSRRDIRTVVGSNSSPELIAASLVDGAKAISVNDLGLVSYFGVDAKSIEWLRGTLGCEGAWLGQENLVLGSARGGGHGHGSNVRATVVAHGRTVAR